MNGKETRPGSAIPAEPSLLAGLIRVELIESTKQLRSTFTHLAQMIADGQIKATLAGQAALNGAEAMLAETSEKMELLSSLAETYSSRRDSNQERLFLFSLLSEIVGLRAGKNLARFSVNEPPAGIAPVYGNKRWLDQMLSCLVLELDKGINPEDKIVFTLRQLGNFMLLTNTVEAPSTRQRRRPVMTLLPEVDLPLGFCRRIAEFHGGSLRLEVEEEGGGQVLTGFTLSMPTSVQGMAEIRQCADCPMTEQIECYAADLAVLMDRCELLEQERKDHA
jgi:hypothetical protein